MTGPSQEVCAVQNDVDSGVASYQVLRTILALAAMMLAFILVVGYGLSRFQQTNLHPLRATSYPASWIRASGPPSHAGYFRKRFDLPGEVKHAWIKIVAADAFEVSVNRNPMGRIYLWRPTRPFQNGISEKGQVLLPQDPAMALNFPREYQWDGHDTWRLPTYVELTPSLRQGKNVITVEVESRLAPARVSFVGEIQLWNGAVIPINSDETWRGEAAIPGPQLLDWTEPFYWDKEWRQAEITEGPASQGYRSHPEQIYTESFTGNWIRHPSAASRAGVTFSANWKIEQPIDEAWVRLITNRGYELRINGSRVHVAAVKPPDLDNGDWVFGRGKAHDPVSKPELLDPDEAGSSFVGTRFETPRKGHENLGMFRNPFSPQLTPFRYIRTYNRAQAPGVWDPKRTLAESRRTPETPDLFPERPQAQFSQTQSVGGWIPELQRRKPVAAGSQRYRSPLPRQRKCKLANTNCNRWWSDLSRWSSNQLRRRSILECQHDTGYLPWPGLKRQGNGAGSGNRTRRRVRKIPARNAVPGHRPQTAPIR